VLGGVGIVGLGAALYLDLKANSDASYLHSTCGVDHSCRQDDVDAVQTKYVAAAVSLGVGVVAIGVATYLFLARPSSTPVKVTASGIRIDFGPATGGGMATLGASF
jgi:hypothetical protein